MPRRRGGKKIDFTRWDGGSVAKLAFAAGTIGSTFISSAANSETWLRFRGNLMAWVDGNPAPGVLTDVGVGMIVMPEGTGTTITSSPISDSNAPWIYYSRFTLGYDEPVTDVVSVQGLSSYREIIDLKAMRILRPDREVQFVVESVTLATAVSINVVMGGRVLLGA